MGAIDDERRARLALVRSPEMDLLGNKELDTLVMTGTIAADVANWTLRDRAGPDVAAHRMDVAG
jgi:hypothetical protein